MLEKWRSGWVVVRIVAALIIPPAHAQADMIPQARNQNTLLARDFLFEPQTMQSSPAAPEGQTLGHPAWQDTRLSSATARHTPHSARENALIDAIMRSLEDRLEQAAFIFQAILGEINPASAGYPASNGREIMLGLHARDYSTVPRLDHSTHWMENSGDSQAFFLGLTIWTGR